jgi:MFS family permease
MGLLGDKIGLKGTFVLGLIFFAIVYTGIIFAATLPVMFLLFTIYGLYAAATEGIAKAWISNVVPRGETATAIGFLTGMTSICTLLASSLAGLIWFQLGPTYAFGISSFVTVAVILYFLLVPALREATN